MAYPYITPSYIPAPQHSNNGIVWVQGEVGAKSQFVAPGTSGVFMDSEAQRFYIKSVDASGIPAPLRIFAFQEVTETPTNNYVTREELEKRLAELGKQPKEVIDEPTA